jgi:hypothetical protein
MIASTMTTTTMPMTVFFLSMITSLALMAGILMFCVGARANDFQTTWLARTPFAVNCINVSRPCGKKKLSWGIQHLECQIWKPLPDAVPKGA